MSFSRDAATTFLSRGIVLTLGLVQSAVVARFLLPEGRGIYGVLLLLPRTLALVAPLGLNWALTYNLRQQSRSREYLTGTALSFAAVLGGAGYLLCLAIGWGVRDSFLSGLPFYWFAIAALAVPLRLGQKYWTGLFLGWKRIGLSNKIEAARGAIRLGLILIALPLLHGYVLELLAAVLLVDAAMYVASLVLLSGGIRLRPRLPWRDLGPMLGYGLRVYAFDILLFLNYRLDIALLRHYRELEDVGYYTTAVVIAELLWVLPNAFGFVLFPTVAGATPEARNKLTPVVCRSTILVIGVACVVIATVAEPAIRIVYGVAFVPAALPLIALLPGIFAMSIQNVLGADISGRGFPGRIAVAASIGLVVNFVLNVWWIPSYGTLGAALASTVSYAVIGGMVLIFFLRLSRVRLRDAVIVRAEDLQGIWARARSVGERPRE